MLNNKEDMAVYFHDQVVAPYNEFMKYRNSPEIGGGRDFRAALDAAKAIYHLREQLGDEFRPDREDVVAQCADYALTRDIADVAKHGELDRPSAQLRNAASIKEVLEITTYKDSLGEYTNAVKEFELHLRNGTSRKLSEVLTNSVNFWCRYLAERDVAKFPEFAVPNSAEPIARSKCTSNADMLITRGLKFPGATIHLQRYNYATGRVEPMNPTGYKVMARGFKPKHEIVLGLRNDSTSEEFRETIRLNPDQSNEFDALTSDDERQNYLSKLPEVASAYARLARQVIASRERGGTGQQNI